MRLSITFLEKILSFLQENTDVHVNVEDTYLSDYRFLGFNKLYFGWGEHVTTIPVSWLKSLLCMIAFLAPPKSRSWENMAFYVTPATLKYIVVLVLIVESEALLQSMYRHLVIWPRDRLLTRNNSQPLELTH